MSKRGRVRFSDDGEQIVMTTGEEDTTVTGDTPEDSENAGEEQNNETEADTL